MLRVLSDFVQDLNYFRLNESVCCLCFIDCGVLVFDGLKTDVLDACLDLFDAYISIVGTKGTIRTRGKIYEPGDFFQISGFFFNFTIK